jgi:hypothetical protein
MLSEIKPKEEGNETIMISETTRTEFLRGIGQLHDHDDYSPKGLNQLQEKVECAWNMELEEVIKTCDEFVNMLSRTEFSYFETELSASKITKETIENFFEEAYSNVFADKIEGYEETTDAQFSNYNWDEILSSSNSEDIINKLHLHFHGNFASPTLYAGDGKLSVYNWENLEEEDNARSNFLNDMKEGFYTIDDVIQSVKEQELTPDVKRVHYSLRDNEGFNLLYFPEKLERQLGVSADEIKRACKEFSKMLCDAERHYIEKRLPSKAVTKENIKKFFKLGGKGSLEVSAFREIGIDRNDPCAYFYAFNWDEILAKENANDVIDKMNLRLYKCFNSYTLHVKNNKLDFTRAEGAYNKDANLTFLALDIGDGFYTAKDVLQSVQTKKFTEAVQRYYSDFLKPAQKEKGEER